MKMKILALYKRYNKKNVISLGYVGCPLTQLAVLKEFTKIKK